MFFVVRHLKNGVTSQLHMFFVGTFVQTEHCEAGFPS
jgi:hypothetical protein